MPVPTLQQANRLHARTAVMDPTPELMKGLSRLFGREAVMLEAET